MAYITPEQLKEIKQIDLLSYLKVCEPQELKKVSGETYCTQTHDSLIISNGLWHWHSRGIGGKSALDYLMKVNGYTLPEAAEKLQDMTASSPSFFVPKREVIKEREPFVLPTPAKNNRAVFNYLRGRGIDTKVIQDCFKKGILYQEEKYSNAVFVGCDETGTPKYAAKRSVNGNFKGEVTGSNKQFGFQINSHKQPLLCVFESAIDLLSYATLINQHGGNSNNFALLSVGGVQEKGKMPLALTHFLESNSYITDIMLCFDNDEVGKRAAQNIYKKLEQKYTMSILDIPKGKDINEYLLLKNRNNTLKKISKER